MAKSKGKKTAGTQNTTDVQSQGFTKNLVEDVSNYLVDENSWTQARNAINNSVTGDIGSLGNEPSNIFCVAITADGTPTGAPLAIIGAVYTTLDTWVLFSTDDSNHQIGIYNQTSCSYYKVVDDPCLNFSRSHLISGVSKKNFQCRYNIYWSDAFNPDRVLSLEIENPTLNDYTNPDSGIPWIQDCNIINGCQVCTNTNVIDCDKIRLESLTNPACLRVEKGASSGLIPNGSYYVVIAYTINNQRVSAYSTPSNVQPLFNHLNTASSLDIYIDSIDSTNYDEFELVLVQFFNGQTVASIVGNYSTRQTKITLDYLDKEWVSISKNLIPLIIPIADKSDAIFEAGNYLIRTGPTDKFDFNYQPLANQIVTKWVSVEYDEDYYREGGNNTGYLRDEVYSFFIRWIYNTGDKSATYHIPGRPAYASDTTVVFGPDTEPETEAGLTPYNWMVNNTAIITAPSGLANPDQGTIVAEGYMGYWESTELYDDDTPVVWNANNELHPWTALTIPPYPGTIAGSVNNGVVTLGDYDLCGKPIRHHKFPDNGTDTGALRRTNHFFTDTTGKTTVRIMGVAFNNIKPPVDNEGNIISNIVGYEILRGSRVGNESIIAKGMLNNMFEYDIDGVDQSDMNQSSVNLITRRKGLYQNYPYNDLRRDYFISKTPTSFEPILGTTGPDYNPNNYKGFEPNDQVSDTFYTFHSPDTQFTDPYLSGSELKFYGQISGQTEGSFVYPDKHPKHKFVTDQAFQASMLIGAGIALLATKPAKTTTKIDPYAINLGGTFVSTGGGVGFQPSPVPVPGQGALAQTYFQAFNAGSEAIGALITGLETLQSAGVGEPATSLALGSAQQSLALLNNGVYMIPGTIGPGTTVSTTENDVSVLPPILRQLDAAVLFYNYFTQGIDTTLRLIKAFSKYQQYALQYQSHCKYTKFDLPITGNKRTTIPLSRYLEPQLQDFGIDHRINNLFRGRAIALETGRGMAPAIGDNSRVTVGEIPDYNNDIGTPSEAFRKPTTPFNATASSHYVGMKQRIRNQYGKIEGIIQVPVSTCFTAAKVKATAVLFNGDTYVTRYTEKNTMFFFANWLYNQPNDAEFNYRLNKMLPYTSFWMDTEDFEWSDFISSIPAAINNLGNFFSEIVTPSDKHCFDRASNLAPTQAGFFIVKNAFMYLFNSGVRDFFVESSINTDLRDWGEPTYERFYDPYEYTDLATLFSTDDIKAVNYFKYDFSLSINKLFNNLVSWGFTHRRDYNPTIAESCYVYRPNRVIYSLPQSEEAKKDYWRVFLPLNYKDFRSKVTAIRPINLNGAIMLFEQDPPVQILGVENLTLEGGTKVTIGDGALFQQAIQYLDNSDRNLNYGSCQSQRSVISTPVGVFYMSQNQGKIFAVSGQGIQELSLPGQLKWWFNSYLPCKLILDFPDFELLDNTVIGVGCHVAYDNGNMLTYFCKKDYVLRKDTGFTLTYQGSNIFTVDQTGLTVELGDPRFFQDASWTLSYDPKIGQWLSYHDWHPSFLLSGKTAFMSVDPEKKNSIWIHNDAYQSYCNYYGKDYPFELEFQTDTVQTVTTMRSIEYQMECYIYADNGYDRYHVLDFNFDEAVIYNSEQVSGLLKLELMPKNNSTLLVQYPIVTPTFIRSLYSKEENKYRINQFWDATRNRGEYLPTLETIFNTEPNGYVKPLNPNNLDYAKFPTQRKKFRHYRNTVLLRRLVSGTVKMLFNIANIKNLNSPR